MNKNQDQELDYRMDSVSENVSDARLSQIFGEALGDEPSKEETLAAWEAFEKKHISSEKEHLQKAEDELSEKKIEDEIGRENGNEIEREIEGESSSRKVSKARILAWITASVAVAASLFLLFSVHPRRFLCLRSSPWNFSRKSLLPSRWSRP